MKYKITFLAKPGYDNVIYHETGVTDIEAWNRAEIRFITDGHLYAHYGVEPSVELI